MLAWGELRGPDVLLPWRLRGWPGGGASAMVSTRKMWGLKGFGKEPGVDTWRGVLIPQLGVAWTWFGLGSVFLAVPLCLLCTSVRPWQQRLKGRRLRFTPHASTHINSALPSTSCPFPHCWIPRAKRQHQPAQHRVVGHQQRAHRQARHPRSGGGQPWGGRVSGERSVHQAPRQRDHGRLHLPARGGQANREA